MKKLLFIYLLIQASFDLAGSSCLNNCPQDPVIGVWLINGFLEIEPSRQSREILALHGDGTATYLLLPTDITNLPAYTAAGMLGYWRKVSEGVYQVTGIERVGFYQPNDQDPRCCGIKNEAQLARDTFTFTLNPNDNTKATLVGRLDLFFDTNDIRLTKQPLCLSNLQGEACRFNFPTCPTSAGVFIGCQSCIGLAIRQKYCSNCNILGCPITSIN